MIMDNRLLAAMPAEDFQRWQAQVARGGATLRLLLLYTQSLLTQMTQTAACNRHHTLNQQFSRWLLLSFDRLLPPPMEPSTTQPELA